MIRKSKTIQSNLFLTYSLIIILVFALFVSIFYVWGSNILKSRAFETIDNLGYSFSEKLDTEIRKMDDVSMNIAYSNLVKERFKRYTSYTNSVPASSVNEEDYQSSAYDNSKELVDMLVAINGPSMPVKQIYLYGFNGERFGTGFENRQLNVDIKKMEWYDDVVANNGRKLITLPHKDPELSGIIARNKDNYYISLCRLYFDVNSVVQGVVEVKQYYENIFSSIDEYFSRNKTAEKILVYDQSGRLIYPIENQIENSALYFKKFAENGQSNARLIVDNPLTNTREMLAYKYSDYTGWLIMIAVSESDLLAPIFSFTKLVFSVAVFILFLAMLFSFFAAKKYTTPIAKLRKIIRSMDLQDPSPAVPEELNSGLNELDELNHVFNHMNIKLKKSVDDLLLSQQHEMQSKMLALQSQMNPHFLYNSLATIGVMAEEEMNEQIVEMCGYISDMLRYISSDSSEMVKISTELEYTEKYLACMKFRHGNKLSYTLDFCQAVQDVKIPKLMIQPLVENAIKYATHKEPPWIIRVHGYISNNYWQVNVEDNGNGFNKDKLNAIHEKIEQISRIGLLPSLELEGMGLLNIYIRLKLIYKNQMIFNIAENPDGGAIVTIGGDLHGK